MYVLSWFYATLLVQKCAMGDRCCRCRCRCRCKCLTILSQLPQLTHLPFPRRSLTILVPNSSLGSDWCRDIYARLPLPQNFHFCEFVDFNSWIIWLRVVVALSEISLSLSEWLGLWFSWSFFDLRSVTLLSLVILLAADEDFFLRSDLEPMTYLGNSFGYKSSWRWSIWFNAWLYFVAFEGFLPDVEWCRDDCDTEDITSNFEA